MQVRFFFLHLFQEDFCLYFFKRNKNNEIYINYIRIKTFNSFNMQMTSDDNVNRIKNLIQIKNVMFFLPALGTSEVITLFWIFLT